VNLPAALLQEVEGMSPATAGHLARAYGGRAREVLRTVDRQGRPLLRPLAKDFPYLEAEVVHAARHEYALHAEDVIARRTRLAFLDRRAP
jgi:glycerol-3-phosphate dehydrogenase